MATQVWAWVAVARSSAAVRIRRDFGGAMVVVIITVSRDVNGSGYVAGGWLVLGTRVLWGDFGVGFWGFD